LRVELERVIDGDDYVVAEYRFRGEGGGSGVQADARFFNAARVRDGLVTKAFARLSLEKALAALADE
jgi:hypothetical protein